MKSRYSRILLLLFGATAVAAVRVTLAEKEKRTRSLSEETNAEADSCGLPCVNGGECRIGRTGTDGSSTDNSASGNKKGHYCFCPTGYVGALCEIKFVLCENSQDTCFNDEPCRRDVDDKGKEYYHCECDTDPDVSNLASTFAGRFCERSSMVYCDSNNRGEDAMYCANSGVCSKDKKACRCPSQWTGEHCNIPLNLKDLYEAEGFLDPPKDPETQEQVVSTQPEPKGHVAWASVIILIGTFLAAMIVAQHYDIEFKYGRIQQRESPRATERRNQQRKRHRSQAKEMEMSHIEGSQGGGHFGSNEVL